MYVRVCGFSAERNPANRESRPARFPTNPKTSLGVVSEHDAQGHLHLPRVQRAREAIQLAVGLDKPALQPVPPIVGRLDIETRELSMVREVVHLRAELDKASLLFQRKVFREG